MYQLSNASPKRTNKRHKKMFTNIAQPEKFYNKVKGIKSLKLAELIAISKLPISKQAAAMAKLGKRKMGYIERLESEANAEVERLLQHMTAAGTRRTITTYRNYIKSINPDHASLFFLKIPREINDKINEDYRKTLKQRVSNLIPITKDELEKLIKAAIKDLESTSYTRLCLALCLLTGRRSGELLLSAEIHPIDDHSITFNGQFKTKRTRKGTYPIPVLHNSQVICEALKRLHTIAPIHDLNVKQGETLPSALNRRIGKTMSHMSRKHYNVKPHDLRALYAEYCTLTLKPSNVSKNAYMSDILGHNEDDISTANSYQKFTINVT